MTEPFRTQHRLVGDIHLAMYGDVDMLATAMSEALVERVSQHTAQRPFFMALAGGSTPQRWYRRLAESPFVEKIPWSSMVFFFGDERCVPADHPDSNYRMASTCLLDKVPSTVYRMEAELGQAESYQQILEDVLPSNEQGIPVFDLVLLGIGHDGHTASLFPGTSAIHEKHRWVVMNDVPQLQTQRMTLTFPVLNAAREIWILATGESKRPLVQAMFGSGHQELDSWHTLDWPIVQIRPTDGKLRWWLDREAMSGS